MHFPSNPLQPGPMCFLTPRKCGLFGVSCEGLQKQVNFLIDEGMSSGKGSNEVISYMHHFFTHFGVGETDVDLHCDNCIGQNKNNMLWYGAWRVAHKLHSTLNIHFLIAGHTKFAPDCDFELIRQAYEDHGQHIGRYRQSTPESLLLCAFINSFDANRPGVALARTHSCCVTQKFYPCHLCSCPACTWTGHGQPDLFLFKDQAFLF
ncbi:hypothetical protein GOODEAATRI_033123 [Goodea atripinnis]|uniref:DUF7869 domain-containing protein n=1 Tax=Goodea atripinnis TaxID=208336 RepID=A0ABV0N6E7_9TELE